LARDIQARLLKISNAPAIIIMPLPPCTGIGPMMNKLLGVTTADNHYPAENLKPPQGNELPAASFVDSYRSPSESRFQTAAFHRL
jgi:hypothetical protein